MEIVQREIRCKPDEPVVLAPLGDIQWAGRPEGIAYRQLEEYIARAMERKAWFCGMGDYPMPLAARILTRRGFLAHDAVRIGEDVLAYDLATQRCRWTPLRRINRPGPLPMLQWASKSFQVRSTPQHTWVVTQPWWRRSGARPWTRIFAPFLRAAHALAAQHRIIVAAPVDDEPSSVITAEEAMVLGWLVTDGSISITGNGNGLCGYIVQSKEPYRTHLRGALSEWYTKEERIQRGLYLPHSRFHLKTKRLRALLDTAGLDATTVRSGLPALVTRLSREARVSMWTAMVEAEGWQEGGHWRFSQKPGPVLDAFRILSALLGYRLSRGKRNRAGVVTVAVLDYRPHAGVADMTATPRAPEDCWCPATDYGTWVAELDGQVTITGNTDFASPSNRQRLRGAALYDTAQEVIEDKARELVYDLYERLLKPTTGRWLFALEGHHWAPLATGETSDQYLCQLLKAPFVGTTVYLGLHFPLPHYGTRTVTIWAHHGAGGGQKVHAPVLKLENLSTNWDADILLVGHMTKRALGVIQRCHPVWAGSAPSLRHREIHLVGVGGWMKGYQEFSRQGGVPRGSYVEQKMLAPVALGAPLITITPHLRREHVPGKGQREHRHWEPRIVVES